MNCKNVQQSISEYVDNRLSARDTWEMDRHFGECNPCNSLLNETRQTINIIGLAPQFQLSDDFMSNLSARLSQVEPAKPRLRWLNNIREILRPGLRPAWAAGLGTCALLAVILVPTMRFGGAKQDNQLPSNNKSSMVRVVQSENIANAASDPLGDTAAASMVSSNAAESSNANNPEPIW